MNEIDFFIWLPFVIVTFVDLVWFLSLTTKQKRRNDANAAGIFVLGLMISFIPWCFREVYNQKGWTYFKYNIADHTIFAVIFGTIASLFALALLGTFFILKTNQNKK